MVVGIAFMYRKTTTGIIAKEEMNMPGIVYTRRVG